MKTRFGPFDLDTEAGLLRRNGRRLRLQDQPLRLLALLVARPGETVTRDQICAEVWGDGTHVDFDQGINHAIRSIRAALHDDPESPRYIETIPRRGYRFIGPVELMVEDGVSAGMETARRSPPSMHRFRRPGLAFALGAMLVMALGLRWSGPETTERRIPDTGSRPDHVLVVLPFQHFGDDSPEYLGDAFTEELISRIGRSYAGRLGVIARTSAMVYKDAKMPVDAIGHDLGATHVVEGTVQTSGNSLRVTAQLIRVADQVHLWAATYDRPNRDLLAIEAEVTRSISEALALQLLGPGDRDAGARTDQETYALYLEGIHASRDGGAGSYSRAHGIFEDVIARDPGFAPGWWARGRLELAFGDGGRESIERARRDLMRAIALDEGLADAYVTLANLRFYRDYDPEGARESFERALAANPTHARAHHDFAAYFSVMGRHEEAIAHALKARSLDPLAPLVSADVGWYYYYAGRFEEAIEASRETLRLRPRFYWADRCIVYALIQRHDRAGAAEHALEIMKADPASVVESVEGDSDEAILAAFWRRELTMTWRGIESGLRTPADLAIVQAAMGDRQQALSSLEEAFSHRSGWQVPFIGIEPMLASLRDEPRFRRLQARLASLGGRLER